MTDVVAFFHHVVNDSQGVSGSLIVAVFASDKVEAVYCCSVDDFGKADENVKVVGAVLVFLSANHSPVDTFPTQNPRKGDSGIHVAFGVGEVVVLSCYAELLFRRLSGGRVTATFAAVVWDADVDAEVVGALSAAGDELRM